MAVPPVRPLTVVRARTNDDRMSVTIEAVLFNHDQGAASQDALNLRRNASEEVRLPEWQEGVCVRPDDSPAAYSIADTSGHTITIKARFRSSNPNPHTVEIRALDDLDDPDVPPECRNMLGQVHAKKVAFTGGLSGLVEFELRQVRLWDWGVGARETTWFWQARDANDDEDEWERFSTTRHRIYSVLRTPTAPWQQAPFTAANTEILWADVLDYACWWAFGAKTADGAACHVTRHVYDLGPAVITYDCPGGGSTHYALFGFDCTAFLERLGGGVGNGYYVNCTDCATITSTFANSLGCDLWQSRMFGPMSFALNEILAIGSNVWQTACGWGGFSYHEVAWEAGCTADDDVFDACLQVDGDADPTTAPHTPLLPCDMRFGLPGDGDYRDRLCTPAGRPNCNPQPATRQRRAVS
jgi:hypothetical protein